MENNKEQYWKEKIIEWEKSGLNQVKFCADSDIRLSTFQYWKGKLNQLPKEKRFIPVVLQSKDTSTEPIIALGIDENFKIFIKVNFHFEKILGWPGIRNGN